MEHEPGLGDPVSDDGAPTHEVHDEDKLSFLVGVAAERKLVEGSAEAASAFGHRERVAHGRPYDSAFHARHFGVPV